MHYSAKCAIAIACHQVYCDHIGWKSWKLTAQTISPNTFTLCSPKVIHLLPGLGLWLWLGLWLGLSSSSLAFTYLLMGDSGEALPSCFMQETILAMFTIVNNVKILAQSSSDFARTYNFQGTHILDASRSPLCDSSVFLFSKYYWNYPATSPVTQTSVIIITVTTSTIK